MGLHNTREDKVACLQLECLQSQLFSKQLGVVAISNSPLPRNGKAQKCHGIVTNCTVGQSAQGDVVCLTGGLL
jgi:hypothetical protein